MMKFLPLSFFVMLSFFIARNVFAIISIPEEAGIRRTSQLMIALNLADNIARRNASIDNVLRNILRDHTENHHAHGASYFRTEDEGALGGIIYYAIGHANNFNIQLRRTPQGERYRLVIHATIPAHVSQELIRRDHIGYDGGRKALTRNVQLCFGINGIETLEDSAHGGAFITAFPSEIMTGCN